MQIEYDSAADILTICGIRYSGELFRAMAFASPGTWLRVTDRPNGGVTVSLVPEETERMFDQLAGIPVGGPTHG